MAKVCSALLLTMTKNISYSNNPSHLMLLTFQYQVYNPQNIQKTQNPSGILYHHCNNYRRDLSSWWKALKSCDHLKPFHPFLGQEREKLIHRWGKSLLFLLVFGAYVFCFLFFFLNKGGINHLREVIWGGWYKGKQYSSRWPFSWCHHEASLF